MAFDVRLASRVRDLLAGRGKIAEKKMMGGLTFMVNDRMCVGVVANDLMARIGPLAYDEALTRKGCREMDFTGKAMRGYVFVGPAGTRQTRDLDRWVRLALDFNKKAKASRK
jgi:TfoX/Sxy family transcriptional regulator of competence genes